MSKYFLESSLAIVHDDSASQSSEYALIYDINGIRNTGQNATIYDKELDMYFEDRSARAIVYEIELEHVYLNLDKALAQAVDFIRRTLYRYDWMQLRVNQQGKVLSVDNGKEIIKQWSDIRSLLTNDYKGKQTEDYIHRIDAQMAANDFGLQPLAQYFYFGLIFPTIPAKHSTEWQRSRIVGLSDFDDVRLNELVSYQRTTDSQLREYSVTGELVDKTSCELKKYSGCVIVPCDDIHPLEAHIEISYNNGDTDINWNLKLTQI